MAVNRANPKLSERDKQAGKLPRALKVCIGTGILLNPTKKCHRSIFTFMQAEVGSQI